MNRVGLFLVSLLLVQLVIVAKLYWPAMAAGSTNVTELLANTGPFLIDEVHIEDGQGNRAVLETSRGDWILPRLGGLPAKSERLKQVLQQLTEQDPGWPVAHTLPARQRFQVAHYHFRRKITLLAQDQIISTVYLGTSPGFRKVHARNDEEDDIFSIPLNRFDTPASDGQWLDPSVLQIRTPLRIVADGYSLDRSSGSWTLGSGEVPDQRELDALLDSLKSLQVGGLASAEEAQDIKGLEADLILEVESLSGTQTLTFFHQEARYFVRSSALPHLFRLSSYTYEKITGIDAVMLQVEQ